MGENPGRQIAVVKMTMLNEVRNLTQNGRTCENATYYVFSSNQLRENVKIIREMFSKSVNICFSVKANPFLAVIGAECADYVEVCSYGELQLCRNNRLSENRIVVGGIYKEKEELEYISYNSYARISIESKSELEELNELLKKSGKKQKVLLRLSSGNQFGIDGKEIVEIVDNKEAYSNVIFAGIHYYSGTQKKQIREITGDLQKIEEVMESCNFDAAEIEYGPGIGVPLFPAQKNEWFGKILEYMAEEINRLSDRYRVTLEFGRLLCYDCGVLITPIVNIKDTNGRRFYIVDTGMHHISYYGQMQGTPSPKVSYLAEKTAERETVTICGSLCTANDILAKNVELGRGQVGDLLVFENVGAYSVTESRALFLSHALPAVYLMEGQSLKLMRGQVETFPLNGQEK